jgi:hypothetical protein
MAYSITTKDGITIDNIPDNVSKDDPSLKAKVAEIRAGRVDVQTNKPVDIEIPTEQVLQRRGTPPQQNRSISDKLIGTGEAALSALTGATSGTLSGLVSSLTPSSKQYSAQQKAEWQKMNPGLPYNEAEQKFIKGAEAFTYAPRTQSGQEQASALSNFLEQSGIQGLAGMPLPVKGAPSLPSEARLTKQLQNVPKTKLLQEANKLGFKVSPSDIGAGQIPRSLETASGKFKTQEALSANNQQAVSNIAREYLGLPQDVPLTSDTLSTLRETYSNPYEAARSLTPKQTQTTSGGLIKSKSTRSGEEIVGELKIARDDARATQASLNNPNIENRTEVRNQSNILNARVKQLENELDNLAKASNQPQLINELKEARKNIAKTYAVENALVADNIVNPKSLIKQIDKGVPISGNLKTAAKFASEYPNVNKVVRETPNPFSVYDVATTAYGAGSGNQALALLAPLRVAARAGFSNPIAQRRMIQNIGSQGSAPTIKNAINASSQYVPYMGLLNYQEEQ